MADIDHIERAYIERAHAAVEASGVTAIAADLAPAGDVLAGWWTNPQQPRGVVRLPNPWDGFEALEEAAHVVDNACTALLDRLAAFLGEVHNVTYDARYWEAIIGPWLDVTLVELLERELFVRAATAVAPDVPVLVAPEPLSPAETVSTAIDLQLGQDWNLALVDHVARAHGITLAARAQPPHSGASAAATGASLPVRAVRYGLGRVKAIPDQRARARMRSASERRVAIVGLFKADATQLEQLRRAVPGLVLLPGAELDVPPSAPMHPRRADLARLESHSALEAAAAALLPHVLPRSVLEHYPALVEQSRARYGKPLPIVHCNWAWGDVDGEYLGRSRAAGRRIAFAQHGGAIYDMAVAPHEWKEGRLADMQLSWGHTQGAERCAPSPWIARLADSHRGGRQIVIVESLTPPLTWSFRLASTPQADQWFGESDLLVRFAAALGPARDRIVLRRFPNPAYEGARHPELEALPEAVSLLPRTATDWLRRAAVAVVSYPETPFIEAMAIGVPTIGIWNPEHWRMRADAQPLMDKLEQVGVVQRDPVKAAELVERIAADPRRWWREPERQAARAAFLARFAQSSGWLEGWRAALEELARP